MSINKKWRKLKMAQPFITLWLTKSVSRKKFKCIKLQISTGSPWLPSWPASWRAEEPGELASPTLTGSLWQNQSDKYILIILSVITSWWPSPSAPRRSWTWWLTPAPSSPSGSQWAAAEAGGPGRLSSSSWRLVFAGVFWLIIWTSLFLGNV